MSRIQSRCRRGLIWAVSLQVCSISFLAMAQEASPTSGPKTQVLERSTGAIVDAQGRVLSQGSLGETDRTSGSSDQKPISSGSTGNQSGAIVPEELKPISPTPGDSETNPRVVTGNCTPSASVKIATPPTPCQATIGSIAIIDRANYNLVCQGMPPGSCSFSITIEAKHTTTNTVETSFTGSQTVDCGKSLGSSIQISLTPQVGTHRVTATIKDSAGNVLAAASCVYTVR